MSSEEACQARKIGDCIDFRKGRCNSYHGTVFCKLGKSRKDDEFLKSYKRHVIMCLKSKRWTNGKSCSFPQKWKSCSFYHPGLGKIKVKKEYEPGYDCKKRKHNEEELKSLR